LPAILLQYLASADSHLPNRAEIGRQWGSDMRLRPPRQWLRFQHAGTPHLATTIGASVISQANPVEASIFGAGFSS
jgi:hypothetical protein